MTFLLDTNVISEVRKSARRADPLVRAWVGSKAPSELHISAITVLEIELGIRRLARRDAPQARRLRRWLEEELLQVFDGRILPVDVPVARRAAAMHAPDPRPERDALIAATASAHGLNVVTRDSKDFALLGVPLINPWDMNA